MSAQQRVLSSPELVTTVLLCLPPRDFLLAQQVSRQWQDIVTTASIQRQKLYSPLEGINYLSVHALLAPHFPCFFDLGCEKRAEDIMQCFGTIADDKIDVFTRPGASWRRMLPILPPIKALRIEETSHGMGGDHSSYRWVLGADAGACITMGQVYDICARWVLEKHIVSDFSPKLCETNEAVGEQTTPALWRVGGRQLQRKEVAMLHLSYVMQCSWGWVEDASVKKFLCAEMDRKIPFIEDIEDNNSSSCTILNEP